MFARHDLTTLTLEGPDAQRFLQGQLTCDVKALATGQAGWGGCCTPKGRLVATFILARTGEAQYVFVLPAGMSNILQAHLNTYRVFFKADWQERAWRIACTPTQHPAPDADLPLPAPQGWSQWLHGDGELPDLPPTETAAIQMAEILAGMPAILPATSGLFLPQAVGLDRLGGVSFSKGCYTGQEVVARARYRGKVKKALYALEADAPAEPGTRITSDEGEPWGTVLRAAGTKDGTWIQAVLDRPPRDVTLKAGQATVLRYPSVPEA